MSCYRERGLPQKAIELYEWARSQNDENLISIPTLISAASAYCDTEQFRLARKCADKAYALNHGKADNILRAVYNRANAGIARQEKLERNR